MSPIERGKGLGNNDLSLIIKVVFNKNQSILFTGDATGKTLEAVWQNDKEALNVRFLVAPHHGSSTEGSLLWPIYVNSLNPYNFAGVIYSAPLGNGKDEKEDKQQKSLFGHPNAYIQRLNLQNRVFSHYSKYHYGKENDAKSKLTTKPIFVTGCVTHLYWLKFSNDQGMSIFHNKDFHSLVSAQGWVMPLQKLINGFKEKSGSIFQSVVARFFQNPEISKCRNADNEKFGTKFKLTEGVLSEETLKLFKFYIKSDAKESDLEQWWEKHVSPTSRKHSLPYTEVSEDL